MPRQPVGRGARNVAVATKVTAGEKALLDAIAAERGIKPADALREGLTMYLALASYRPPPDPGETTADPPGGSGSSSTRA
jgi:hypothetical protein